MLRCASLITGHSGSGKSPLGDALQNATGLPERFIHLDFGARLRGICNRSITTAIGEADRAYIESVMQGSLFDNAHFELAGRIIDEFIKQQSHPGAREILLLNGFPRDRDQAAYLLQRGMEIRTCISIECDERVACDRIIRAESGCGFEDRRKRNDRAIEVFRKKVRSYHEQTRPMITWLRHRGTQIVSVPAEINTGPRAMIATLRSAGFFTILSSRSREAGNE